MPGLFGIQRRPGAVAECPKREKPRRVTARLTLGMAWFPLPIRGPIWAGLHSAMTVAAPPRDSGANRVAHDKADDETNGRHCRCRLPIQDHQLPPRLGVSVRPQEHHRYFI